MNSSQYRVFVCTKQRPADSSEGCCCDRGALDIYQAFQDEVDRLQLGDRVEVRKSGCLDRCEAGVVAMVYQPNRGEFNWLPTKLRVKLRKLLFPKRYLYGNLTTDDVRAIVQRHLLNGQVVRQSQISTNE
ncbi:(2Fe-2S) ferredoxin domain-containing protein [Pleurocapsales cyanobacterium LEGE 10410]|nr:(2Fe-2S) ferredoxin domain-containing protein [Pleurocapsales cyanobacterium LEGE 10410]